MPDLFGVDIAGEIAKAFSGKLRTGTLIHLAPGTRTSGALSAGTNSTESSHSFDGFVEIKEVRRRGQIGSESMSVLTIMGGSIKPAVIPAVNDKATIDSLTFEIVEILGVDPASAVYECAVA